ncbi:MAG: tetratricopeptide repeat protein [Deltaproteobacteria bacterium]|nr:tetratricopeptide repeat protein [Deltaproteobacteria bacterium]
MHVIKELNVMIVDDSKFARDQIKRAIASLPFHKIFEADGGGNAIAALKQTPAQLILSDLKMAKMSGLALLKMVRETPELKDTAFIMLLEDKNDKEVKEVMAAAAHGCLFKPINEDKAKELILDILSKTIDPNRESMYVALEAASQFRKEGLREEAIAEYEKAVNFQDNVPARLALGKLYLEDEEFKKSMDNYIAAIKLDHQSSDAFNGMGQLFKEMKDYPNAMKILNESLRIAEQIKKDPDLIGNANFNIGDVQLEMNEIKAALESFERASQAAPGNQDLQVAIGDALMDKALDEEAVMFFKKAITLDPYKLHVYNRVGIALRKMKRYKEAIQEYKKGIELVPNEENLYYNVSRAYFEMGNLKLAENYIKQALDINQKFDDGAQLLKLIQKTAQTPSKPPTAAS